jgi:hypothetical protein
LKSRAALEGAAVMSTAFVATNATAAARTLKSMKRS